MRSDCRVADGNQTRVASLEGNPSLRSGASTCDDTLTEPQ